MELLNKIQQQLKVPKAHQKPGLAYKYRNAEDILEGVKPLLGDAGTLTLTDEIVMIGDRFYVKATATLNDGKATADAVAYAREELTKPGMDAAKITGAASSYARKYALNGLFCIDDTKDADDDEKPNVVYTGSTVAPKAPPKPAPAAVPNVIQVANSRKVAVFEAITKAAQGSMMLGTKEEFEAACFKLTGLALKPDNFEEILAKLEQ